MAECLLGSFAQALECFSRVGPLGQLFNFLFLTTVVVIAVSGLVALSRIPGPGVAFLGGWATDRLGPRKALGGVFLTTGMATVLLGMVHGVWIIPVLFLQPVFAVCFFPAGFAALSKIGPPKVRNVAVSLTIAVAFLIGGGGIPTGIGIMAEEGFFSVGIMLVGALLIGSIILIRYLAFYEEGIQASG